MRACVVGRRAHTFRYRCSYGRVYSTWYDGRCDHRTEALATDEAEYAAAAADIVQGQQADTLSWFDEAAFEDSTLVLGDEGKDHPYAATAATARCCLQVVESNFPMQESARISPRNQNRRVDVDVEAEPMQHVLEEAKGIAVDVQQATVLEPERRSAPAPVVVSPEDASVEGSLLGTLCSCFSDLYYSFPLDPTQDALYVNRHLVSGNKQESNRPGGEDTRRDAHAEHEDEEGQQGKSLAEGRHNVKLFVNNRALADARKLLLEGAVNGAQAQLQLQLQDDKDNKNGDSGRLDASTLTSGSTSKSSVEWQSSTVTKDSETEYPFSCSSRRSSARWEPYTLFRKYDEDMVYFHRVGAQKLTETGTVR
jgi:hypothetical protein